MRSACEAAYVPGAAFDRFFTIWLENQDDSKVDINSDIQNLTKQGILLENYYGLTHPSQPNYIASVGGDFFGLNHDEFVKIPHNVTTVVDLFEDAGITWKGYFEGMPGPGYMGEGSTAQDGKGWDYVRKHNPFVSYESISGAVPADKRGTVDTTIYSHYSILSTLQNNWKLPNLGRYDVGANVFSLCASKTNYTNINLNMTILNNSLSYPGFLNNDPAKWAPVPVPNLQLEKTPYDGSGEFFDGGNGVADERKPVYGNQGANVAATATVAQPYSASVTPTASSSGSKTSASSTSTKGSGAERSTSVGMGCGKEVLGLWVALVFAVAVL
ncbi:hypothetical protein DID88_000893 [Monilinia fructigena]|uniref:Uncharacterized protein n=1 Tax=Monilinia fructigena TaxID=38457 RepID=A0A395IYJ4_9HELO|nr:hypothetical protein DID88_000893 [Monilinia fructigena]